MELNRLACDRARRSRDARFDGRFFIAVTSTGVYCRPICPARAPKDEHIRYFPTASAAEAAGFRPCLRCRPGVMPGTPAWLGTSGVVSRALRLIGEGALDRGGTDRLADRLGVTSRHLRRLFLQHLGAAPLDVARARRLQCAKRLLDDTTLAMGDVAVAAGFRSLRRFNSEVHGTYDRTPTALRQRARPEAAPAPHGYRLRLTYRPPYDWSAVLAFLRARATPGVEHVDASRYRRTIAVDGAPGALDVAHVESLSAIDVDVRVADPRSLLVVAERVRRVFDLGANPSVIAEHLGSDPWLQSTLARHPGVRMPGAWDGFEIAVRAILGQQVSVRAATTIAGRIAATFGTPVAFGQGLERVFPTPAQLAHADVERAGVMPARAETIRRLAGAVDEGRIAFDAGRDGRAAIPALEALPGIGRWTAEYIAMRAFGEPDAFPSGDRVLCRVAGDCTARELDDRSEAWRPWRAYAVMLLWQRAGESQNSAERAGAPISDS